MDYPQINVMKTIKWSAVILLGLITLFTSFTSVGVGQVIVITRLGSVNREVGSGIHPKLPWGIERSNKFDIKTQKDEAKASAASSDLQDVEAIVVTNYHIEAGKVGELFRTVGIDYKIRVIDPAIQESLKASTAKYAIGELITKRAEVKETALKALQARLSFRGIVVEDISLTDFVFSGAYKAAITQKQVAEQQAQQAKYLVEKNTNEAAAAVAAAEGNAKAEIAAATGKAEAQRLLQQSLTPELLKKYATDKWDGKLPVNYYGGSGDFLFNIPAK